MYRNQVLTEMISKIYCLEKLSQSYFLCIPCILNGNISGMALNAAKSSAQFYNSTI